MRNKTQIENSDSKELDIYNVIVSALRIGLTYQDLGNMSLVQVSNILDAYFEKPKHKPTQAEIDLIT